MDRLIVLTLSLLLGVIPLLALAKTGRRCYQNFGWRFKDYLYRSFQFDFDFWRASHPLRSGDERRQLSAASPG